MGGRLINKRRTFVAIPLAVIMSPIILAGFIGGLVWQYVLAGNSVAEHLWEYLDKWFDAGDID